MASETRSALRATLSHDNSGLTRHLDVLGDDQRGSGRRGQGPLLCGALLARAEGRRVIRWLASAAAAIGQRAGVRIRRSRGRLERESGHGCM
jgi:hypothetical protein